MNDQKERADQRAALQERVNDRKAQLVTAGKIWPDGPQSDEDRELYDLLLDQIAEAKRDLAVFENPPPEDGFRERTVRPKGWAATAMAEGTVRDPSKPEPPRSVRKPGDVVIELPVATLKGNSRG